jgi:hypothetical protein
MDTARKLFCCVFYAVTFSGSFLLAEQALADIYKCPQPDGLITFSDQVCPDGTAEAVAVLENSPLDSTAERENIARYQQQELGSQRKSARQMPQVWLIQDADTEERNARIMAQGKTKKKSKTKKRRKPKTTETTH